jgi:catechol 2,3-dioxygenase-like lactoylglutathione lyase family enzyme
VKASQGRPGRQHLVAVQGFHVVTLDLPRLAAFYRDVLGFGIVGDIKPIGKKEMRLLGLQGGGPRQVLSIGSQTVAVDQFEVAGRSYPPDSDAASLWFQHLALVVVDIAEAHARLRDIAPISIDGPQQLPASSGGVLAFKFRDSDGHPFELVQFSPGNMPAIWKDKTALPGEIALGIDHSAISVHDADTSVAFYVDLGIEARQAHL